MAEQVAISLPWLELSDEEETMLSYLRSRIYYYAGINGLKHEYYEGRQKFLQLGISVPPQLQDIGVAVGWPGTVVDALEERLDWQGWSSVSGDVNGLDDIYKDNYLDTESSRVHLDSLICGTGFVTIGKGDVSAGEPEVLITGDSAMCASAIWDYRTRRITAGLSQTRNEWGQIIMESLYLPNETIQLAIDPLNSTATQIIDRDRHGLGRPLMVKLNNRDTSFDIQGRSEITRAVKYYTDAACRTMLGMEINREFYTAPQRYALGAEPEQFGVDENSTADERMMAGWRAAMGRLNIIPATEDGEIPQMGQFPSSPPTPYVEQMRLYSQMLASESGLPAPYFGFSTDNPPSADAIRQIEYPLVKRAERRQAYFSQAWREVGYLSLLVRDKEVDPDFFRTIEAKWGDASTPTRAAAADEALKLVTSGVLTADSTVTYDRIGLSQQEQATLEADKRKARLQGIVNNLASAAQTTATANPEAQQLATQRTPLAEQ